MEKGEQNRAQWGGGEEANRNKVGSVQSIGDAVPFQTVAVRLPST